MPEHFRGFSDATRIIRAMANRIGTLPDDPEDTVTVSVTRKEAGILYYACNSVLIVEQIGGNQGYADAIMDFMMKFEELVTAQKWEKWVYQPEDG